MVENNHRYTTGVLNVAIQEYAQLSGLCSFPALLRAFQFFSFYFFNFNKMLFFGSKSFKM